MKKNIVTNLMLLSLVSMISPSCSNVKTFTIEWKLEDGTVLKVDNVEEGSVPQYTGETPTKESTNDKVYTFEGWTPEVVAATENASYVATFSEDVRKYEIKWANFDGTVLKTDYLEYGASLVYSGETPTRPDGDHQSYIFDGWNFNGDTLVTKDATYTAKYKEVLHTYTVTWMCEGVVVEVDENVEYGMIPSFDGDTPTKATTAEKMYYFDGWDKKVVPVESDVTYNAIFRDVDNIWNHYPKNNPGVTSKGSKEYWQLVEDPTEIVFEKPSLCTVNEKEAPSAEDIATWAEDDARILQPLYDGKYVTLGSYPTNKIEDEELVTSLTEQLTNTAPTAADSSWKAYTHWFNWDSSQSKAVAKKDALYQDITYQGAKYRAVYFNSELPKNCSQAYSSSNQYQQSNGYNKQTLYFFDYQPLKWTIVEEAENHYALVATKILDGVCFTHDGNAGYVGAYNDMRLFTENSFYNWAFDDFEKEFFTEVTFKNDKASGNNNDSVDLTKVITIPSKTDIETKYFKAQEDRKKTTTDYAKLNGVQVNAAGQAYWWTRSRSSSNPYRLTPGASFDNMASGYFSSAGILPQIFLIK